MRITKRTGLLVAIIAVMALLAALAAAPVFGGHGEDEQEQPESANFEGGQILVKFKSGTTDNDKEKIHKAKGGKVKGTVVPDTYLIEVEGGKERKSKDDYKKDSKIDSLVKTPRPPWAMGG